MKSFHCILYHALVLVLSFKIIFVRCFLNYRPHHFHNGGGGGGHNKRRGGEPPVRMMYMNRLPKPPKYPLYDMPDLGMATPPPPPLMHPMASMASTMFSTYVKPGKRGGSGNRQPPRGKQQRRPLPPPHIKKRPQGKNRIAHTPPRAGHRRPPPSGNHNPHPQGYEHTMQTMSSSNVDPQINSPPLGRPLNYDEYMERPSHSFTDDPWNFDPFAANYNSGMNTYAMKYNYDPLGE